MTRLAVGFRTRFAGDDGSSLVEYALLVAFIAVVCISAVLFLGAQVSNKLDSAGVSVGN